MKRKRATEEKPKRGRKVATPKAKRKRKPKAEEGKIEIPLYKIGSIIQKPKGVRAYYILKDHIRGFIDNEKRFTIMRADTEEVLEKPWTPFELAIYGYEVVGKLEQKELQSYMQMALDADGTLKQKFHRKKRRSPLDLTTEKPGKCGNGKRHSLKNCKIAEGENPLARGARVSFQGRKVVGVKVFCPDCGKKVRVLYYKNHRLFVTATHTPKRGKGSEVKQEEKPKRKRTRKTKEEKPVRKRKVTRKAIRKHTKRRRS